MRSPDLPDSVREVPFTSFFIPCSVSEQMRLTAAFRTLKFYYSRFPSAIAFCMERWKFMGEIRIISGNAEASFRQS